MSTGDVLAKKKGKKASGSESRRYGTLVRLDDEVVADAKIVASIEGVSMAELLSTILGPILKKRAADGLKKRYGKEQP